MLKLVTDEENASTETTEDTKQEILSQLTAMANSAVENETDFAFITFEEGIPAIASNMPVAELFFRVHGVFTNIAMAEAAGVDTRISDD